MLSKLGILVSLAFVGNAAMASYAIDCGKRTNPEEGEVKGSIFQMSSEDENFKGPPSKKAGNWGMTYQGVEFPPTKGASIFVVKAKGTEHIKAFVITALAKGKLPHKLVITEPYSEEPSLEIRVGGLKSATFKCISFID